MTEQQGFSAKDRRRRERRIWRTGILVSLLFHLLIFFGWRGNVIPLSPFAAAGPRSGDNRAAAGSMQAMNVRTPPPTPVVPPLVPLPADVMIEPVEFEDEVQTDPSAVLGDAPGLTDLPGLETGTGQGDGGNADEGLYRLKAPSPRGMIMPPAHEALRGREIQVWVFVDATGHVVADSTRLEPRTGNRDLDRRLIREAAGWLFNPGMQEGRPVASWFPYKIGM